MPLWSDPVGWSEQFAKTKLRVFIWILIHIASIPCALFLIIRAQFLSAGIMLMGLIGISYPCMYIYAMHRLLRIIKDKGSDDSVRTHFGVE